MPVDKFGRSNNKGEAVDGVSLSFITNQFQRKSNEASQQATEIESLRKVVNLQKDQLSELSNSEVSLRSSLNSMEEKLQTMRKYVEKNQSVLMRSKSKHYITIWAEENGGLTLGSREFSFGNGLSSYKAGYTVLTPSKIKKIGMSVTSIHNKEIEHAGVSLVVNGEIVAICNIYKPAGVNSHVQNTPDIILNPGDVINFVSEITTENIRGAIVSLLLEVDL